MFASIREDISCAFKRDPATRSLWEVVTCYPGLHAIWAYRVAHWLWLHQWFWLGRWLAHWARWFTGIEIHPGARIGKRFFIDHGMGVVIGETTEIGNDVTLYHGVTLGGTTWQRKKRHPTLGDGVIVGTGAKILGAITVGAHSRIGANSVVLKDVPQQSTVIGIPGRVVVDTGPVVQEGKINLDHHQMPDPVSEVLRHMLQMMDDINSRIDQLHPVSGRDVEDPKCEQVLVELRDEMAREHKKVEQFLDGNGI